MLSFSTITFDDFYFNGKFLSDFGGQIGGINGFNKFSALPAKDIKTEKILGVDGELAYGSQYQPRIFTVPVLFSDITRIREISTWLNTKIPADFYFVGDTVKISVMFNSVIDIESYYLQGIVDIQFIAYNPFYYSITESLVDFTSGFSNLTIYNTGNMESYPLIRVEGTGDITITIAGTSLLIKNVVGYVYIDCLNYTCYKGDITIPSSCTLMLGNLFDGINTTQLASIFPKFNVGANTIVVNAGTVIKVQITPRSRWI